MLYSSTITALGLAAAGCAVAAPAREWTKRDGNGTFALTALPSGALNPQYKWSMAAAAQIPSKTGQLADNSQWSFSDMRFHETAASTYVMAWEYSQDKLECVSWTSPDGNVSWPACTTDNLVSGTAFNFACNADNQVEGSSYWCAIFHGDPTSSSCVAAGDNALVKIDGSTVKCDVNDIAVEQVFHLSMSSTN